MSPVIQIHRETVYMNRSILLLVARMDSLSLFTGKSPGADSVLTALLAMIAIAECLHRHKNRFANSSRQVIFTFYGGESLNYIGSSYHAYWLRANRRKATSYCSDNGAWCQSGIENIDLHQVGYVLELSQLAAHLGKNQSLFWLHTKSHANATDSQYLRDLLLKWSDRTMQEATSTPLYPPSSVHTFASNDCDHIEKVVISNHEGAFTNLYYHSIFDLPFNVLPEGEDNISQLALHLSTLVTIVSRTLAEFLLTESNDDIAADHVLIDQLVYCFFVNQSCPLLNQSSLIDECKY